MKATKFIYLLCSLFLLSGKLYAQKTYTGKGIDIVNQLLNDSSFINNVHLKLTLVSKEGNGDFQTQKLEYNKYGDNWMMKNSSFLMLGNERYQIIVDQGEKLVLLSEELENQKLTNRFLGSQHLDSANFEKSTESVVIFSVNDDSLNQRISYTVDTNRNVLIATEITIKDKSGNQTGYYKIQYDLVERLNDDQSITRIDSIITIKKRKAILLSPYTNYFLYDNRKAP